jgi:radical SAM superfamily enzyme YgiQ (UPF0313 family)
MAFDFAPPAPKHIKNKVNDIVLALPNMNWFGKRVKFCTPFTVIALTTIMKEAGYDFTFIDGTIEDISEEDFEKRLKTLQPKIVLISSISTQYASQTHLATKLAKKAVPNCITVHGGIYATTYPEGAIKDLNTDYIFTGPAENRLPQVIEFLLKGKHDDLIDAVDGIGYRDKTGKKIITSHPGFGKINKHAGTEPDYSKVNIKKYLFQEAQIVEFQVNFIEPTAVMQTSIGCVHDCTFCATSTITGRKIMNRNIETVLDEMGWYIKEFGIKHFGFIDELMLVNKKRCFQLFQGIIDRKYDIKWKLNDASVWHMHEDVLELMKKSGCTKIGMSAESGSQRVLREIMNKPVKLEVIEGVVKKCKQLKMDITSNFIIGMPDETWDEILQTIDFAEKMDFDLVTFNIAQPFAGTAMIKTCIEKGYLPKDFDCTDKRQYGNSTGFITTPEFTPTDLLHLRTYAWDYINFKTYDKKVRSARCLNVPLDKIDEHRLENIKKLGIHTVKQNFSLNRSSLKRNKNTNGKDSSNYINGANNGVHFAKQKLANARLKKYL